MLSFAIDPGRGVGRGGGEGVNRLDHGLRAARVALDAGVGAGRPQGRARRIGCLRGKARHHASPYGAWPRLAVWPRSRPSNGARAPEISRTAVLSRLLILR